MNTVSIAAGRVALLSLVLTLAAPKAATAQVAGDSATITGTVTTEGGIPLSNARVTIPSLQLATTTNDAGSYRIGIPAARFVARGDTLRVVRLGFRPENVGFTLAPGRVVANGRFDAADPSFIAEREEKKAALEAERAAACPCDCATR